MSFNLSKERYTAPVTTKLWQRKSKIKTTPQTRKTKQHVLATPLLSEEVGFFDVLVQLLQRAVKNALGLPEYQHGRFAHEILGPGVLEGHGRDGDGGRVEGFRRQARNVDGVGGARADAGLVDGFDVDELVDAVLFAAVRLDGVFHVEILDPHGRPTPTHWGGGGIARDDG